MGHLMRLSVLFGCHWTQNREPAEAYGARTRVTDSGFPAAIYRLRQETMQGPSQEEWREATAAAAQLGKAGADLEEQLSRSASCLIMDYVPGVPLCEAHEPFSPSSAKQMASDLGRWTRLS